MCPPLAYPKVVQSSTTNSAPVCGVGRLKEKTKLNLSLSHLHIMYRALLHAGGDTGSRCLSLALSPSRVDRNAITRVSCVDVSQCPTTVAVVCGAELDVGRDAGAASRSFVLSANNGRRASLDYEHWLSYGVDVRSGKKYETG
jgi:hypothetical protein